MKRVFVRNNTGKLIKEVKPGLGEFNIPPNGGEVEVFDVKGTVDTPIKTKAEYLRYTARQVADSIVNDYQLPGLEVVEREVDGLHSS